MAYQIVDFVTSAPSAVQIHGYSRLVVESGNGIEVGQAGPSKELFLDVTAGKDSGFRIGAGWSRGQSWGPVSSYELARMLLGACCVLVRRHLLGCAASTALSAHRGLHSQFAFGGSGADRHRHAGLVVMRLLLVQSLAVLRLRVFDVAGAAVARPCCFDELRYTLKLRCLRAARNTTTKYMLL